MENEPSSGNRDSNKQDIRRRLHDRPRRASSGNIDTQSTFLRSKSDSSETNLRHKTVELVDSVLEVPTKCAEQAKEVGKRVVEYVVDHALLPHWLVDNEFLISGHRPPMPSVKQCFASIFRLHTETVNIWTHLLGALFFICITIYYITQPASEIHIERKIVFCAFFLGAIICLLFSTLYHTLSCHSPQFAYIFNKRIEQQSILFIAFGLFGFIPTIHYTLLFGFKHAFTTGAAQWLALMAVLYITGASLYAARIPERLAPGYFDIWFQSHQIFHVFVVAAACVHYYGICVLSRHQASIGDCRESVRPLSSGVMTSFFH
ncbi:unnamed protein product [Didymodactylos carnosus]|uniref:Uncharacterized protein n=1 Tax=Didymodactylos carnosus TaxID=1234261 RepID=A0A814RA53_9BILA|nr:unnamed protein product [Didymodactylos carnosus]CAF3894755.1 unnamed protein product [Didymodactylos carnosus]